MCRCTLSSIKEYYWLIFSIFIGILSCHSQSFWIDEGTTAFLGTQPTLSSLWQSMIQINGSEVQMPLFSLYAWLWERIFGYTEWILRASNLPWIILTAYCLRKNPYTCFLFLLSPFLIYYTGEFRPYAMQIGAATWVACVFFTLLQQKPTLPPHSFFLANLFLCAISLSSTIWSLGIIASLFFLNPSWIKSHLFWKRSFLWGLAFIPLAIYYLYALRLGSNPARIASPLLFNLGISFYEVIGLSGIGPNRLIARVNPKIVIHYLPVLLPAIACLSLSLWKTARYWTKTYRLHQTLAFITALGLPIALFCLLTIAKDFRFSGRHFTPLLPFLLIPLGQFFSSLKNSPLLSTQRLLFYTTLLIFIVSSFRIRFHPDFAKEDYRTAIKFTHECLAENKKVFWIGALPVSKFYQLNLHALSSSPQNADIIVYTRLENFAGNFNKDIQTLRQKYKEKPLCTGFSVIFLDK